MQESSATPTRIELVQRSDAPPELETESRSEFHLFPDPQLASAAGPTLSSAPLPSRPPTHRPMTRRMKRMMALEARGVTVGPYMTASRVGRRHLMKMARAKQAGRIPQPPVEEPSSSSSDTFDMDTPTGEEEVDPEAEAAAAKEAEYQSFVSRLRSLRLAKARQYYRRRGRPSGTAAEKLLKQKMRPFVLTPELEKKISEVVDTTFGPGGGSVVEGESESEGESKKTADGDGDVSPLLYDGKRGAKYIARQGFRAFLENQEVNYDLLARVLSDLECHNPLMQRSADISDTILQLAIDRNDKKAIKMILDFLSNMGASGFQRSSIRSNLQFRGVGSYSRFTYGRNIRQVNMSRGSREGNNAFATDGMCYQSIAGGRGSDVSSLLSSAVMEAIERGTIDVGTLEWLLADTKSRNVGGGGGAAMSMGMNFGPYGGMGFGGGGGGAQLGFLRMSHLRTAIECGRAELAAFIGGIFLKSGGYNLNKMHLDAMVLTPDQEFEKYRISSTTKKVLEDAYTPVHCAAINPHTSKFLRELLEKSVSNRNLMDLRKRKPLHYAAACSGCHNLDYLVAMGADLTEATEFLETPLMIAAENGRVENVEFILSCVPECVNMRNQQNVAALHLAARNGHADVIRAILECPDALPNIRNAEKETAAIMAAKLGHLDVLRALKEGGADLQIVDKHGKGCLVAALTNFHLEIAKYLIVEVKINPYRFDTSENSMVHFAAGYDNVDGIRLLQACDASLNVFNSWKSSALQIAMLKNNWFVFDLILDSEGIDVNAKDDEGKTMVYLLLEKKDEFFSDQVIDLVKKKSADASVAAFDGTGLFHLLALNPKEVDVEVAQFLLDSGASIDLKMKNGSTPLSVALANRNRPMVEFLLKNGAALTTGEYGKGNILHTVLSLVQLSQRPAPQPTQAAAAAGGSANWGQGQGQGQVAGGWGQQSSGFGGGGGGGGWGHPSDSVFGGGSSGFFGAGFGMGVGGARTKQTARKSTGGKAPRKQLASFGGGGGGFGFGGGGGFGQPSALQPGMEWYLDEEYFQLLVKTMTERGDMPLFHEMSLVPDPTGRTPMCCFLRKAMAQPPQQQMIKDFVTHFLALSNTTFDDHRIVKVEPPKPDPQAPPAPSYGGGRYGGAYGKGGFGKGGRYRGGAQPGAQNPDDVGKTPLYLAVESSHVEWFQFCLTGSDVNAKTASGRTPLHAAVILSSKSYLLFESMVMPLIKRGADVALVDNDQRGIVHFVFLSQDHQQQQQQRGYGRGWNQPQAQPQGAATEPIELLSDLFVCDVPIDEPDRFGRRPLHYAAIRGATISSMFLIDHGADVNARDEDGNTPLGLALLSNRIDYAICLINKNANIRETLLELGDVNQTDKERMRLLAEANKKQSEQQGTQLGSGFMGQRKPRTRRKRRARRARRGGWGGQQLNQADQEETKKTPISIFKMIIGRSWTGLFFLALSTGISLHEGVGDALSLGRYPLVLTILSKTKKSDVQGLNAEGENLFHVLSKHDSGSPEFLRIATELLNRYEVDPHLPDANGCTPFLAACYSRNVFLMRFYMEHCKPNVNVCDAARGRRTALMHFILKNDLENVQALLMHPGLDVNVQDVHGRSAIFFVAQTTPYGSYHNARLFRAILQKGCDLSLVDEDGKTVFFYVFLQRSAKLWEAVRSLGLRIGEAEEAKIRESAAEALSRMEQEYFGVFPTEYPSVTVDPDYLLAEAKFIVEEEAAPTVKEEDLHAVNPVARMPEGSVVVRSEADPSVFYDVVLCKTDIQWGPFGYNNFYKMQVIRNPHQELYVLCTNYGRVGETGQYQVTPFKLKEEAILEFKKVFRSKTRNHFDEVFCEGGQFEPQFKKYRLVDILHRHRGLKKRMLTPIDLTQFPDSKLPEEVRIIMHACCDLKLMRSALTDGGIDMRFFQLGNLSRDVLVRGRELLDEIDALSKELADRSRDPKERLEISSKISLLSSEYYGIIPAAEFHSSIIRPINQGEIENKRKLLERMLDFESIIRVMVASTAREDQCPLDYMYDSVQSHILPLAPGEVEYDLVSQMMKSTTMGNYGDTGVRIRNIYKLRCKSDSDRFVASHGTEDPRILLFHGTKVTNILSILQKGLLINPTNAAITGRLFGNGLYFSDSFTKSLNYCRTYGGIGLMLVCEVALGKPYRTFFPEQLKISPTRLGIDSVVGMGWNGPGADRSLISTLDGVRIPNDIRRRDAAILRARHKACQEKYKDIMDAAEAEYLGEGELLTVSVQAWNQTEIQKMTISERANVSHLKKKIEEEMNVLVAVQRLMFLGRLLQDAQNLGEIPGLGEQTVFVQQVPQQKQAFGRGGFGGGGFGGGGFAGGGWGQQGWGQPQQQQVVEVTPTLNFNQFILYDESRVRIRYMIRFEESSSWREEGVW